MRWFDWTWAIKLIPHNPHSTSWYGEMLHVSLPSLLLEVKLYQKTDLTLVFSYNDNQVVDSRKNGMEQGELSPGPYYSSHRDSHDFCL